ncbi:hypothetical protein GCM10022379_57540 [Micromonospora maritima]
MSAVFDAVVQAHYPDRIRVAQIARARAQAAQSVVTVFAGALVATFTFTSLASAAPITRVAACVSVFCWLAAAACYVRAIATGVSPAPDAVNEIADPGVLIREVLKRGDREARQVDRRQAVANVVSLVALAATLATMALALFVEGQEKPGVLVLNDKGQADLRALCGRSDQRVEGTVDVGSINGGYIAVDVRLCGDRRDVTLRFAKESVAVVLTRKD